MKKFACAALTLAFAVCFTSLSFAEEGGKPGAGKGPRGKGQRPSREEMLKKFDKDGDGKLNEEERTAAREEFRKKFGERGGKGRPGGRPGFDREEMRKKVLEAADKNGNGKIDEDERPAVREFFEKMRKERGFPGGPGGRGGEDFEKRRAEMIKKFDKDGDGKLDETERKAMFEELRKNRPEGKGRFGRGKGRPGPEGRKGKPADKE